MKKYTQHFQARETPQSEKIPGSSQVANSAGGFTWVVDDWTRLDRFLILGTEGGSYYATEKAMTIESATALMRCLEADGLRTVRRIAEISMEGRAPKNNAALFALALASSQIYEDKFGLTRRAALTAIPQVARTGTHLFQFLEMANDFRGWGTGMRKAIGAWYNGKEADSLAYQLIKYRQREGWSHRDALRLAHPVAQTPEHSAMFRWVVSGDLSGRTVIRGKGEEAISKEYPAIDHERLPGLIGVFESLQAAGTVGKVVDILRKNPKAPWEAIPTTFLGEPDVWATLLPNLPTMALIRNLGRMTANGCLKPLSEGIKIVQEKLKDEDAIRKSRIHPIAILGAMTTYGQGHGALGKLTWGPIPQVMDALDEAFYMAFKNVEPTGKRMLLAMDVSGSMASGEIASMPGLSPRVASAAMAMVTAKAEPNYAIVAFTAPRGGGYGGQWGGGSPLLTPLDISPKQRLDDIIKKMTAVPMGGTDCALPMVWALQKKIPVDAFVVYTDNETWAGTIHPVQALNKYRREMNIPAKLIVVGMVANEFTIADPNDSGMLDVVGFDTAAPAMMADFVK